MSVRNNDEKDSCTAVLHVVDKIINTGITLSKSLVTDIPYHSGELVSFKINLQNILDLI